MPYANVGGVALNYEILGPGSGPAMALSPGGRNPYQHIMPIAKEMAANGYRVLLHDRRNCGASDVSFDATRSEYEVWADDLDELLRQFDMAPAIIGGSSSGARLALTFALRHPKSLRALILWRVTGGGFAVKRLAERYYDQYVRLAGEGGMAAVCAEEHFAELIRKRPVNRDKLMAYDPNEFIRIMRAWRAPFVAGAELPLIGTSESDLRSIRVPTCIIPGNDLTHDSKTGEHAARLMPDCEVASLGLVDQDVDIVPAEEWYKMADKIAAIFADFLARKLRQKVAV
ncbi:MAG: alpha/beta hydrolase [Xanthobacteraceae bacterium]|nr:alpha/beta hydrolase [Xanthobacteraceae bacterium]